MTTKNTETTENASDDAKRPVRRLVMCDGYLPDFEGKPVLASCENCVYCGDQSDGPEYGPAWHACENEKMSHMSNLKGFPFKTAQKCCQLGAAYLVDWAEEARKQGYT